MNLQVLFIFQILADIVLCIAIVFILYLVTRESRKKPVRNLDPAILNEFQRVLDASQRSVLNLVKAMDESRKALKEIAFALDERESRLRALMAHYESMAQAGRPDSEGAAGSEKRYESVPALARQGMTPDEIAGISGLTRGEIDLIIDLDQKKNEPQ